MTKINGRFEFTLRATLEELRVSMNQVSQKSNVRPATIIALCNGETKELNLKTLIKLLDTLNQMSIEYRVGRTYTIEDVLKYIPPIERR